MSHNDDLSPSDGLSNVWIEFDGLDSHLDSGNADVRFRFVLSEGGHHQVLTTISLSTPAQHDGVTGLIARAHDEMIQILRQGLWTLDTMRRRYRSTLGEAQPKSTSGDN